MRESAFTKDLKNEKYNFINNISSFFKQIPCPAVFFDNNLNLEIVNRKGKDFIKEGQVYYTAISVDKEPMLDWLARKVGEFLDANSDVYYVEKKIETETGIFFYKIDFSRVFYLDNVLLGVIVFFNDITLQNRAYEELEKVDKVESLGVLAAGIAHDFNNYLALALSNVSLAKAYQGRPEQVAKKIKDIENVIVQAKELTRQLSLFVQGGDSQKEIVDLKSKLKEMIEFFLSGSRINCSYKISSDLRPVKIDKGQLGQVINNIIINARQAMPSGGVITVEAHNVTVSESSSQGPDDLEKGDYAKIAIKDEGPGIPEKTLKKIFNPFFTTKAEGSGLGLAVVSSIVNKYGGAIRVSSALGKGTTFNIYLPATYEEELVESQVKTSANREGRILIIDDDENLAAVTKEMLSILGYQAETAKNGEEALKLFDDANNDETQYDAVLIDLTIPSSLSGKKILDKLLEINPEVKAIACSGYPEDPAMKNPDSFFFKAALPKPYGLEELAQVLQKTIGQ